MAAIVSMQKKYACVRYVHTRITLYHACKIDLRYCKAVHSCITCKLLHQVGLPCAAIHYGICSAVVDPGDKTSTGSLPRSATHMRSGSREVTSAHKAHPHKGPVSKTAFKVHPTKPGPHTQVLQPAKAPQPAPQPPSTPAVVSVTKKPVTPVLVVNSNDIGPARSMGSSGTSGGIVTKSVILGTIVAKPGGTGANVSLKPVTSGTGVVQSIISGNVAKPAVSGVAVGQPVISGSGVIVQPVISGVTVQPTISGSGVGKPVTHTVGVVRAVQVVSKPGGSYSHPGPGFSELDGETEDLPAFPVSPEDKLTVPNGSQKEILPHGVLREMEQQPQDRDAAGERSSKDPIIRDNKSVRSSPSNASSSASSTASSSPTRVEDKENKPKMRDLPVPRIPSVRSEQIPQFHFPMGKPAITADVEAILKKAAAEFAQLEGGKAYKQQMGQLTKACGFPVYWKILFFRAAGGDKQGFVTQQSFAVMLTKLYSSCHDDASKFVRLLAKPGRMVLEFEDFVPLIQDIVDGHPGLTFLQDAPEFHSRYIHTVISRIYFCVNRSWSGRITVPELRRSTFLQVMSVLEEEEDINQVTEYFSYEHFYVIYCKFWELDKDHDLYIDRSDLARHNDHALNSRIIDRIFSGAVTRGKDFQEGRLSYKEFVWFLISEEDKKHPTSIEYWFRCMDLDGDGIISMFEMEYFYEEQMQKMEALGIEKLPFEDCLCQMFDLVRPQVEERITLRDLKNCRMANIFFDTFFNLDKFLEHEQRDPFANARDLDNAGNEISDWDRYAAEEYDILVAEEGMNEQEEIHYEDDFEPDEDEPTQEEMARIGDSPQRTVNPRLHPATTDDIYDFSGSGLGF